MMLPIVLILALILGFLAIFFHLSRRAARRSYHHRIVAVIESNHYSVSKRIARDPEEQYVDGLGYIIGDVSCLYNARSSYVRCAINPSGLCADCRDYQSKNLSNH